MNGVILFVDDKVDDYSATDDDITRTLENQLFEELRKDHPVLGVKSLDLAEQVVKSVGSFSAIILDWIFADRESLLEEGEEASAIGRIQAPRDGTATLEFLNTNDFYSLVYVFSNEDVKARYGKELNKRFPKRIKFRKKDALKNQASKILGDINKWKEQNEHLSIPSVWTCAVNQAFQRILFELATADKNWIRELGKSASDDGGSGEIFIIEILQNLLSESLVQNVELKSLLKQQIDEADPGVISEDLKSVAKLFRRLFYTKLDENAPIMTGDICQLSRDKFGIIITPECDIASIVRDDSRTFELLTFSRSSFDQFLSLQLNYGYSKANYKTIAAAKLDTLRGRFNNGEAKYHLLPSFPFADTLFSSSAVVNLSSGCERFKLRRIKTRRTYKLNSPFIQQLRQRYLSYLGRVGTPSLPRSVRDFNLQ